MDEDIDEVFDNSTDFYEQFKVIFLLAPPLFSTKMKNAKEPIRDAALWNPSREPLVRSLNCFILVRNKGGPLKMHPVDEEEVKYEKDKNLWTW